MQPSIEPLLRGRGDDHGTIRILIGMLLVMGSGFILITIFGFATTVAGDLEQNSPEWWPRVLGAMFRSGEAYAYLTVLLVGVGLCLYRPGMKLTKGRLITLTGVLAILLGLFLRAASREQQWMEIRSPNPDGTTHVIKKYRNWFGKGRTVETDQP